MSSDALRTAVRAAWPTLMPDVPFYETTNQALPYGSSDPALPALWGTLLFLGVSRRPLTMGLRPYYEETGTVRIVVLGESGVQDTDVSAAISAAARAWDGWMASSKDMWFSSVGAPQQLEPETRGDWFQMGVDCSYSLQERVTLPTP